MEYRKVGHTELKIAPLVLGGNVFGWTAGREALQLESHDFAALDAGNS